MNILMPLEHFTYNTLRVLFYGRIGDVICYRCVQNEYVFSNKLRPFTSLLVIGCTVSVLIDAELGRFVIGKNVYMLVECYFSTFRNYYLGSVLSHSLMYLYFLTSGLCISLDIQSMLVTI